MECTIIYYIIIVGSHESFSEALDIDDGMFSCNYNIIYQLFIY